MVTFRKKTLLAVPLENASDSHDAMFIYGRCDPAIS